MQRDRYKEAERVGEKQSVRQVYKKESQRQGIHRETERDTKT